MPTPVWARSADELLRDMRGSRGLPSERAIHTPQHPTAIPFQGDTRDMVDFLPLPTMSNTNVVPSTPGHWVPPSAALSLSSSAFSEAKVATLQAEFEQARREKEEAELQLRHKISEQDDIRRAIATISKEKVTLEQLHLEGQLENAGLREQVKELAETFQLHIRETENSVCEHCPVLHQEIEAGRRECKKVRDQLEKATTATDAHRLRADLLAHDVEDLKTQINELSSERGLLVTEMEMQQRRYVEIDQQNVDFRGKVASQESEITHMSRTIKDLSTESSKNESENRKLACENSALAAEVSTLKTFNSQSQEQTRKLESELRAAHDRIQESEISRVQGYELKNKLHADMVAKEDLVEHLREKISKMEKQKKEMLSSHDAEIRSIQDEKADISSLHEAALTQVESKLRMIESLRAEMDMSEEELAISKTSREALKKELADLSSQCKKRQSEHESANSDYETLLRDIEARKAHEEKLKLQAMETNESHLKKIRNLEDTIKTLNSDNSDSVSQITSLHSTLREQQKQTEAAIALHAEAEANNKRIQSQLQSSTQEISLLQESLRSAHATVATTQNSLKDATKELTAQHTEYLRDRKAQSDNILQLETELSAAASDLQKATDETQNQTTKLIKEQQENAKNQKLANITEAEATRLRGELQAASAQIAAKNDELQSQSESITKLQREHSTLQRELLTISQQKNESDTERSARIMSLERDLEDIKRVILPAANLNTTELDDNSSSNKSAVQAANFVISELTTKTDDIKNVTKKLASSETELSSVRAELAAATTTVSTLQSQITIMEKEKIDSLRLTQQLDQLTNQHELTKAQLSTSRGEEQTLSVIIKDLKQEATSLREQLQNQSATIQLNTKTVEQLQAYAAEKENEAKSLQQSNERSEQIKSTQLQEEVNRLKETISTQSNTLKTNIESVERLHTLLAEKDTELEALRTRAADKESNAELRIELDKSRETIERLTSDYSLLQQKLRDAADTDSLRSRSASPSTVLTDRTRQLKDDCLRFTNEIKRLREENASQSKELQFLKDVNTGLKKEMDDIIACDSEKSLIELELRRQTAALQAEVERARKDMAERQIIEVGVSTALAKSEEENREKTNLLSEIEREKDNWKARAVESEDYISGIRGESCAASELQLLQSRLAGELPSPSQQILIDRCRTAAGTVSDNTAVFVSECIRTTIGGSDPIASPRVVSPLSRAATPSNKQRLLRT